MDVRRLRHLHHRRASSSRSTRRTPPRSASGSPATPSRWRSCARTPRRWRRSSRSATSCRTLRHIVVIDASGEVADAISLDDLRERGRGRDHAELIQRAEAVTKDDPYTFIYTSGTTGPPKGCVLTHGNYRAIIDSVGERGLLEDDDDLTYLFLPLAHAFALLIQLVSFDVGAPIAYFGGDTKQIIPELSEVKPTYLPSVPRIFEKLYTLVSSNVEPEHARQGAARSAGSTRT